MAQQQADVAHRAIDLMYRSLSKPPINYWKYAAIASFGLLAIIILVYWKSGVNLRLVPENSTI